MKEMNDEMDERPIMEAYDSCYDQGDIDEWREAQRIGKDKEGEYCNDCKSRNIKVSKQGNKYCADLCWTEKKGIKHGIWSGLIGVVVGRLASRETVRATRKTK